MSETELQPAAEPPKRRWHQYSLRTLLLLPLVLALVFSAVYSWPYVQGRYIVWRLQDYVDRDLRNLPKEEGERVDQWIVKLRGKNGQPYLLHNADIPGIGRRLVVVTVVEEWFGLWSPNDERTCGLDAIDPSGRATSVATVNAGSDPLTVSLDESRHGFLCLTLETTQYYTPPVGLVKLRCFFRIADGRAETVRVEKADGTLWPYSSFVSPPRTEMQSLLDSADRVQQLRGLAACLYGIIPFRGKDIDDKARRRLSELANSPDPWISEEAKMALEEAKKK